ncbi:MAG: hypothetical protein AAF647_10110, partial [Pseudomonadota bacterium]
MAAQDYYQNYIDGRFVDGGAGRIDVVNPGTGEHLAKHAMANADDVAKAVAAAKRVHESGAQDYYQNYIDGRFVDGGAGRIDVVNPGTGEHLA